MVSAIFKPLSDTPALRSSHNNEGEESSPLFELMRRYQTQIDAINALQQKIDDLDERIEWVEKNNRYDNANLNNLHWPSVVIGQIAHPGPGGLLLDKVIWDGFRSVVWFREQQNILRGQYLTAWRDLQTTQESLAAALAGKVGPSLGCGADALYNIKPPRPLRPPPKTILHNYIQGTIESYTLLPE